VAAGAVRWTAEPATSTTGTSSFRRERVPPVRRTRHPVQHRHGLELHSLRAVVAGPRSQRARAMAGGDGSSGGTAQPRAARTYRTRAHSTTWWDPERKHRVGGIGFHWVAELAGNTWPTKIPVPRRRLLQPDGVTEWLGKIAVLSSAPMVAQSAASTRSRHRSAGRPSCRHGPVGAGGGHAAASRERRVRLASAPPR